MGSLCFLVMINDAVLDTVGRTWTTRPSPLLDSSCHDRAPIRRALDNLLAWTTLDTSLPTAGSRS